MTTRPGAITLFGSGETSPGAQKIYHALFTEMSESPRVAILETPAGFEPNSAYVAGQVGAYLQKRLQNFRPEITIAPARRRGTPFSPDAYDVIEPVFDANVLFMGPGSPTYAVRQLRDSLAWHVLRVMHRTGANLIFSSAMVLAAGRFTLPIYEIYKVGEDLHWKAGLDLFGDFGLSLILVSHWNNQDGGDVLDTSRCYLGQDRFEQLLAMLPNDPARRIVGIDEATALTIDVAEGVCQVRGAGAVTIIHAGKTHRFGAGAHFSLDHLGAHQLLLDHDGIPEAIWQQTVEGMKRVALARRNRPQPGASELQLLQRRTEARNRKDWAEADRLRQQLESFGWRVIDAQEGSQLEYDRSLGVER